jgi:thiol-disulfide isomerase/thioredoxin
VEKQPVTGPARTKDSKAQIRKLFGLAVFMVLLVFALWQIRSFLEGRGVDAKVRALAPSVGADLVLEDFDPAVHDRELESPPWGEGAPPVRLSDFSGKVVFLNFWASYCEPCKRELPSMTRLARELGDDVVMVAVSYDPQWEAVAKFFVQIGGTPEGIKFVRDPLAETDPLGTHYGTTKIPETYVIKDGRILFRFVNERNWMDPKMVQFFRALTADG